MSCPANIPLIYSLHNEMSKSAFNNSKTLTFLEKKTIKENHAVIAVSQLVLEDYEQSISKIKHAFVLPNFISDKFFIKSKMENDSTSVEEIKLVAVGNIKNQKNYSYLLKAFKYLKKYPISLDIYGEGSDKEVKKLQTEIDKKKLAVILKGEADNIHRILPHYDLYVSCSTHEGFGIAAVEAMASGLPLLLSDLPVFREVTFGNALFFDVSKPSSFVDLMTEIFENKHDLKVLSNKGLKISKKYSKEIYIEKLFQIYNSILKKYSLKSKLVNA
jgi:glycosyltransferase involved in cell wall biosynthesis